MKKQELKIHVLFAGIFFSMIAFMAALEIWNGVHLKTAFWNSLISIRPMEMALLFGFWYQAIASKRSAKERAAITTLDLNE
jgi:hypothetical protein